MRHHPKLTIFVIASVGLLMIAAYPLSPVGITPVHAATVNIALIGSLNGWNYSQQSGVNPPITVKDTDNVFLTLTSTDVQHRFYVDVNHNGIPDCNTFDLCSANFDSTNPANYGWAAGVLPQGTYTYYCTYHQVPMHGTIRVISAGPDFTLSASTSSISIVQGNSGTTIITITSTNGFSGRVSLRDQVSPSGPAASQSPSSVTVTPSTSQTSTLTVTTTSTSTSSTGNYTI